MRPHEIKVKRPRPAKPAGRVFVIHDAAKGPPLESCAPSPLVPLRLPAKYGYAHRQAAKDSGQGFVYERAKSGIPNGHAIGATSGQGHVISRRNVSRFLPTGN